MRWPIALLGLAEERIEEIRNHTAPALDEIIFRRILSELSNEGQLMRLEGGFKIPDLNPQLSGETEALIQMLLDYASKSGLVPISAGSFCKLHNGKYNKNEIQRLLDHLYTERRLVRLNNMRFMTAQAMERIKDRVRAHIKKKGELRIADCKEVLGYGRTVGVPVFEFLDAVGFTRWDGARRTLKQES